MYLQRHLTRNEEQQRICHTGHRFPRHYHKWLHTLIIAVNLALAQCETEAECSKSGWFGQECMFQCHCKEESQCQPDGECIDGCADYWFGPKCQYRYAQLRLSESNEEMTTLTDNNASSCLTESVPLTLVLPYPHRLTWARLEIKKQGDISNVKYEFRSSSESAACSADDLVKTEETVYDLICEYPIYVETVYLTGKDLTQLCSLYLGIGQNVALKQPVTQSNTLEKWVANKAVDGYIPRWSKDTTEKDLKKTCARTGPEEDQNNQTWTLTLNKGVTHSRIVIYGGMNLKAANCCESDLAPATVSIKSRNGDLLYSTFLNESGGAVGKVIVPDRTILGHVKALTIESVNHTLTVCEVQVFKEVECFPGHFGLECERKCFCDRTYRSCHPATGICPRGCQSGYMGKQCNKRCPKGKYGPGCVKKCSPHCKHDTNVCHPETGFCYRGCKTGYAKPFCDYKLCTDPYFFGKGCRYRCNCWDKNRDCDRATGQCRDNNAIHGNCGKNHFGVGCQEINVWPKSPTHKSLLDVNDNTCVDDYKLSVLTFYFGPRRTRLVRIVAKNLESISGYQITLKGEGNTALSCHNQWNAAVANNTRDFLCLSKTLMNRAVIVGKNLGDICTILIGRGRNIAINRPSRFVEDNNNLHENHVAERGNDGFRSGYYKKDDYNTCAHSGYYQIAEKWEVTLPSVQNITYAYIQNRVDKHVRHRLNQHTIQILDKNKVVLTESKDKTDKEKKVKEYFHDIPYTGSTVRYVRVVARKGYCLNFCEVEIYGSRLCPQGKYGLECEFNCNCKRGNDYCFAETGACPTGCRDGFRGYDCWKTCDPGTFGSGCSSRCSDNCFWGFKHCSDVDGECTYGCVEGFRRPDCRLHCFKGTYGKSCDEKCSPGCAGGECDRVTGYCKIPQCQPGYLDLQCRTICSPYNYGLNCLQNCSENCASAACHHENGRCDDCPRGTTGHFCEDECPEHTHGPRCIRNCSNSCYEAQCEPVDGKCRGCEIGLEGPYCEFACEAGSYGWGCKQRCSKFCVGGPLMCHATNGSCFQGCEQGMPPPRCIEPASLTLIDALVVPLAALLLFAIPTLCVFCAMTERRQETICIDGGERSKGSEAAAMFHKNEIISLERSTALSKDQSIALSKERSTVISNGTTSTVLSKSKELASKVSGAKSSVDGRPASSGKLS